MTEEEAVAWIKQNSQLISTNQQRTRYLNKLGLERQEKQEKEEEEAESRLEKEDQFENDKYYINFFSQRTSQDIRNRYLSRLNIEDKPQQSRPHKKGQHSTFS